MRPGVGAGILRPFRAAIIFAVVPVVRTTGYNLLSLRDTMHKSR